jgi:hypothetical protein
MMMVDSIIMYIYIQCMTLYVTWTTLTLLTLMTARFLEYKKGTTINTRRNHLSARQNSSSGAFADFRDFWAERRGESFARDFLERGAFGDGFPVGWGAWKGSVLRRSRRRAAARFGGANVTKLAASRRLRNDSCCAARQAAAAGQWRHGVTLRRVA